MSISLWHHHPAIDRYNAHAQQEGKRAWSLNEGDPLNLEQLRHFLGQLSPQPRPEAEEHLLQFLIADLLRAPLSHANASQPVAEEEHEAEQTKRQHALEALTATLDWGYPTTEPVSLYSSSGNDLAYTFLDRALASGMFNIAWSCLKPFLNTTIHDYERPYSLLSSYLAEAEAGNPAVSNFSVPFEEFTSPIEMGNLLLSALIQDDDYRYVLLGPEKAWPLSVDCLRQRAAKHNQSIDTALNDILRAPHKIHPSLWKAVFEACRHLEDQLETVRFLHKAFEVNPTTGQPHWQDLWKQPFQASDPNIQMIAWLIGQRFETHPDELAEMLALVAHPINAEQHEFAARAFLAYLDPQDRSLFSYGPHRALDDATQRQERWHKLDSILDHLPNEIAARLGYHLVAQAFEDRGNLNMQNYPELLSRFKAFLPHAPQSSDDNLFRKAIESQTVHWRTWDGPENALKTAHTDLVKAKDLVAPGLLAIVMVELMTLSRPLPFMDPEDYQAGPPLPVTQFYEGYFDRQEASLARLQASMENVLNNSSYPEGLRRRFLEGCRPLRPLIGEAYFRSEERAQALTQHEAHGQKRRIRS